MNVDLDKSGRVCGIGIGMHWDKNYNNFYQYVVSGLKKLTKCGLKIQECSSVETFSYQKIYYGGPSIYTYSIGMVKSLECIMGRYVFPCLAWD